MKIKDIKAYANLSEISQTYYAHWGALCSMLSVHYIFFWEYYNLIGIFYNKSPNKPITTSSVTPYLNYSLLRLKGTIMKILQWIYIYSAGPLKEIIMSPLCTSSGEWFPSNPSLVSDINHQWLTTFCFIQNTALLGFHTAVVFLI
jgi:hypothetical protein